MAGRLLLTALLLGACAPAGPTSPVDGVVTDVRTASLTEVEQFSLLLDSGETLVFAVDPGDPDLPASELRDHLNFAMRVRVWFRGGEQLVAERVEHGTGAEASMP